MIAIIGIGSPHGDDQLGWIAIDRLTGESISPAGATGRSPGRQPRDLDPSPPLACPSPEGAAGRSPGREPRDFFDQSHAHAGSSPGGATEARKAPGLPSPFPSVGNESNQLCGEPRGSCLPAGIVLHKVRGGIELLECLDGQDTSILIDAAAPSGRPGAIRTFVWPCPDLATVRPVSSHGLGLVEALQLAESLGRIPKKVLIYTIEARTIAPDAPPSPEVVAQLDTVLAAVRLQLPLPSGPTLE
jgi:hydrogenase maturation protease